MAFAKNQLGLNFSTKYTTAASIEWKLGQIESDNQGDHYQFVKATGALVIGSVYVIDKDFNVATGITQTVDDTAPVALGIPTQAFTSGEHGWVLVGPFGNDTAVVKCSASCAADALLYTTATAGELDDLATSAKVVVGLKLTTAVGGAAATAACMATQKIGIYS